MDQTPKPFVLGHVNGQLESAFKKLAALHAKNNFSCAIITGNLFAASEDDDSTDEQLSKLLAGEISVPISTYFTVGTRPLPPRIVAKIEEDNEYAICENLHYLGKRSVTKTTDGIRIVALGGLLDHGNDVLTAGPSKDQHLPFHSLEDEKALKGAHAADILLTAVWPQGIHKGSHVALPEGLDVSKIPSSEGIADLVATLRPRYHFTASPEVVGDIEIAPFFFEREGFFHPERQDQTHSLAIDVTRFISLAAYGNASKAKAMYAFTLTAEAPTLVPAGCTPSPFLGLLRSRKRAPLDADPYPGRFHLDSRDRHGGGGGRHNKRARQRSPPPGPDKCFFCLSNPNLPTHMVCSIGNDAYLATAKGPLPTATTFTKQSPSLNFPGHMIIVPLSHAATISAGAMSSDETGGGGADGEAVAASTYAEMTRFRRSLQAMVASRSKQQLGTVTWEISRARNIHVHWQVIPVPADLIRKGLVEAAFRVEADNLKLPSLEEVVDKDEDTLHEIEGDYFRVWISAEQDAGEETEAAGNSKPAIVGKTLVMKLDPYAWFDLQYGRKVLAKLTGLEKRIIWQDCVQTEEEETADVAAFREAFNDWDFTLQS